MKTLDDEMGIEDMFTSACQALDTERKMRLSLLQVQASRGAAKVHNDHRAEADLIAGDIARAKADEGRRHNEAVRLEKQKHRSMLEQISATSELMRDELRQKKSAALAVVEAEMRSLEPSVDEWYKREMAILEKSHRKKLAEMAERKRLEVEAEVSAEIEQQPDPAAESAG